MHFVPQRHINHKLSPPISKTVLNRPELLVNAIELNALFCPCDDTGRVNVDL